MAVYSNQSVGQSVMRKRCQLGNTNTFSANRIALKTPGFAAFLRCCHSKRWLSGQLKFWPPPKALRWLSNLQQACRTPVRRAWVAPDRDI
jgi:hypothetical protein